MNISVEIRKLALEQAKTLTFLAERISEKKNKHYSVQNLSKKLKQGTVNINELSIILDELSYEIKFERKN